MPEHENMENNRDTGGKKGKVHGGVGRYIPAVLLLCALLLLINLGIPALNEKLVYDGTELSSHLVEGHEPRTVTEGKVDWLVFNPYLTLDKGTYQIRFYYSTDTEKNIVEAYYPPDDTGYPPKGVIYHQTLSPTEHVHEFEVSLEKKVQNFICRVLYGGEGSLSIERLEILQVRKDLAAAQYALDIAIVFLVAGYLASRLPRKAAAEETALTWGGRVKNALPVALLLAVTLCVAGPVGLYVTNAGEFWFSLGQMAPMMIVCFAAVTVAVTVLLSICPRKLFYWVLAGVFGFGVALYVEGNFLVRNLGLIDGSSVEWDKYSAWAAMDIMIFLLIIAVPLALLYFQRNFSKKLIRFGSIFLILTQLLAAGLSVASADNLTGQENSLFTTKNLSSLSKEDNIFILMSDGLDAKFVEDLLETEPEYTDLLDDFTWYRNASSSGFATSISVPSIFTGVTWKNEINRGSYLNLADQSTPLFKALAEKGYDVCIFTELGIMIPNQYMSNAYFGRPFVASQLKFGATWMKLVGFRYFPQIFKGLFNVGFTEFNANKAGPEGVEAYPQNDTTMELLHRPLSTDNEKKTFHFYHFEGAHAGFNLNENGYVDTVETTALQKTKGSFEVLFNYIKQMKELGIYDNSTIIFMADHGAVGIPYSPLNPAFMIKPKGYTGNFSISDAPISYADLLPTFLDLIGQDGSKYGRTIFEIGEDEQRERESWIFAADFIADGIDDGDKTVRSVKFSDPGGVAAMNIEEWTVEGSLSNALTPPLKVANLTEKIEDVNEYNSVCLNSVSEVRCDFPNAPVGDVQVNMTLYTLTDAASHLVVTANGTEVFNDSFVSGTQSFTIPDALVDNSVTLQFSFPEAANGSAWLIVYDFAGTNTGE